MTDAIVALFFLIGGTFTLLAAVGIVRLPDFLTRMQASTKSATLGVGCILVALVVEFAEVGVTTRAGLVIGFLFLTAPVAAHMIARAGYHVGVPQWDGAVADERRAGYNPQTSKGNADLPAETNNGPGSTRHPT